MNKNNIVVDEDMLEVHLTLSLHELAQINASLCWTIAAIIETKEETKDSVSLDPVALEKIYTKLSILSDRLLQIERNYQTIMGIHFS